MHSNSNTYCYDYSADIDEDDLEQEQYRHHAVNSYSAGACAYSFDSNDNDDDTEEIEQVPRVTPNSPSIQPLATNPHEILARIENLIVDILLRLSDHDENDEEQDPQLPILTFPPTSPSASPTIKDMSHISQSRSISSIFLVLKLVHSILTSTVGAREKGSKRNGMYAHSYTVTTRQVYYYFVTHFKSQRECDATINEVCRLLRVPRIAMGIVASPKGWFCGAFQIHRPSDSSSTVGGILDGTALHFTEGIPITRDWLDYIHTVYYSHDHTAMSPAPTLPFILSHHPLSPAKIIVVIEKEAIYHRLVEEMDFFISQGLPCIFITGKGYPDLATRGCVSSMVYSLDGPEDKGEEEHVSDDEYQYEHSEGEYSDEEKPRFHVQRIPQQYTPRRRRRMPVVGICDCNPFGVHVLQTYRTGGSDSTLNAEERQMYACPSLEWIGLYPTAVQELAENRELPRSVFQQMTRRDVNKIDGLMDAFDDESVQMEELRVMQKLGYKVELEALHWLGMDYLTEWVRDLLVEYLNVWESH